METITINDLSIDSYDKFINAKKAAIHRVDGMKIHFESFNGHETTGTLDIADHLWDYQQFILKLALARRRFAIFSDVGTGKTAIFLEWVRHVSRKIYPKKTLIITQLHLIRQTIEEQMKFYRYCNIMDINNVLNGDIDAFLNVKNSKWEGCPVGIVNTDKFNDTFRMQDDVGAVVLDESSILKSETGKRRSNLINSCKGIPFKLACTATPAPNDRQEYANHCLFLEFIDNYKSFFTKFFYNTGKGNDFLLKPHAKLDFYRFLSTFSVFLKNPSNYGFADILGDLKPPEIVWDRVSLTRDQLDESVKVARSGQISMFAAAGGMVNRNKVSQIAKGFVYGTGN
jgi:hypothetical protein